MKFKKIENGLPDTNRAVQVLLYDNSMSVGYYKDDEFEPANVYCDAFGGDVFFECSVIAWAELPEVVYE